MVNYRRDFYIRRVVEPKIMNFQSFETSGLYFHHHLAFQGILDFVSLNFPHYVDLIKVFYLNLKVYVNGYLLSKVNKKKIKVKPNDWFNIAHLMYQGKKLSYPNIPEYLSYERQMALDIMVRPDLEGEIVKIVRSLNINYRLLHFMVVHWLTLRPANFAKVLKEDIFMIWALKNKIYVNWPHHIMQTMLKSKGDDAPLPYGILITRIMQYNGVDLFVEVSTTIGLR